MYWIEERLREEEELNRQRKKIDSGSGPLWSSVCPAMKDSVAAHFESRKYARFEPDGKNDRVFWVRYVVDTPNRDTELKKRTVTMDASERTITAEYKGVPFEKRTRRHCS